MREHNGLPLARTSAHVWNDGGHAPLESGHVSMTPEKPAIVIASCSERVTYREMDRRSKRLARLLRAHGLRTGDVIAALTENHPRFFEIFWAAQRWGSFLYGTPMLVQ